MLHVLKYGSVKEIMDTTVSNINVDTWERYLKLHTYQGEYWWGCELKELEGAIKHGWLEGLTKMKKFRDELEINIPPPIIKRKKKKYGSEGDEIIPEKFYQGEIDTCWIGTEKMDIIQTGKMLTFKTCLAYNAGVSGAEYFWTGAACIVLTDMLENMGYRVEILGFSHTTSFDLNFKSDLYIEVEIKSHDQQLDMENLVTTTALSGFDRYYLFKCQASVKEEINYTWGSAKLLPPSIYYNEGDYIVSGIHSRKDAVRFINKMIDKLRDKEDV